LRSLSWEVEAEVAAEVLDVVELEEVVEVAEMEVRVLLDVLDLFLASNL
jgi:hypothetical protein